MTIQSYSIFFTQPVSGSGGRHNLVSRHSIFFCLFLQRRSLSCQNNKMEIIYYL